MYVYTAVCTSSYMYQWYLFVTSRRWELRVEGKARSRPSSRRSSFESKVRASFKLEVAGGPVESVESKVFGASSRRSTFESKVGASSRRWDLRVEGGTFESKVGPQGWVQFTPRASAPADISGLRITDPKLLVSQSKRQDYP